MISADLSNLGKFIAAVEGTLDAIASPGFEEDFLTDMMNDTKRQFMIDAIAARDSQHLQHMFEWGPQNADGTSMGESSTHPLFRLVRRGGQGAQYLTFDYLPSTVPVPLPTPSDTGFDEERLEYLSRHIFYMKAVVIETQASVTVAPKHAKALFIPTAGSEKGFVFRKKAITINPGGPQATGAFTLFWKTWFETEGQVIASRAAEAAEQHLAATGRKVIRYKAGTKINGESVGGRFARGKTVSFGYSNAERRSAEQYAKKLLNQEYRDGRIWDDE